MHAPSSAIRNCLRWTNQTSISLVPKSLNFFLFFFSLQESKTNRKEKETEREFKQKRRVKSWIGRSLWLSRSKLRKFRWIIGKIARWNWGYQNYSSLVSFFMFLWNNVSSRKKIGWEFWKKLGFGLPALSSHSVNMLKMKWSNTSFIFISWGCVSFLRVSDEWKLVP